MLYVLELEENIWYYNGVFKMIKTTYEMCFERHYHGIAKVILKYITKLPTHGSLNKCINNDILLCSGILVMVNYNDQ